MESLPYSADKLLGFFTHVRLTLALSSRDRFCEDKECLSKALFYLHWESTGSAEDDIRKLASPIQAPSITITARLPPHLQT
jgi:hypothetical protein